MSNLMIDAGLAEAGRSDAPAPDACTPHARSSPKDEYRAFSRHEASLPLFARDWWLDAAVGAEGWNVVLVKRNDEIVASMPYVLRSRYGFKIVTQPSLTPALGPWLRPHHAKAATQFGNDKELMQELIDQLPGFDRFSQTWHSSVKNWQPFFWNGFQQTTYYTYVLTDLSDAAKLWNGLEGKVRRAVNKATNVYRLEVRNDLPIDDLLVLNRMTFERQGLSPPYSDAFVRRLDAACAERGCRKSFIAVDPEGVQHAGCHIVWDEHSAYSLIAGGNPALRASAANSLCLWASIQYAAGVTRQYNFTGSMIEPFECYLRTFGGVQVPYFHISKTRSRLLKLRQGALTLLGKK